ncbi:hypothetical protein EAE96_008582 [Botrytis aclada]|nr:hypothetical protein EAE96_008582 [Botrytis aclada]
MLKAPGDTPNRLGLNDGNEASEVEESSSPAIKMEDKLGILERHLWRQNHQNLKTNVEIKTLARCLKEQCDQNETRQKTQDQKLEYYDGQVKKLDESVQKLVNEISQLKGCIAEDIQRQYQDREALNNLQDVQFKMKNILSNIMEQQHSHLSSMIEFQTQLPDFIQRELSLQRASIRQASIQQASIQQAPIQQESLPE